MKYIFLTTLLLVLFFIIPTMAIGQGSPVPDSLLSLLKNSKPDENRVFLLNELAWEVRRQNIDSAKSLSLQAFNLSEEIDYVQGKGNSLNLLGIFARGTGDLEKAVELFSHSLRIRKELDIKEDIAKSYNNLGNTYRDQGKLDEALDSYFESLAIKEKLGDSLQLANGYLNIGVLYYQVKDYSSALTYFEKCLPIFRNLGMRIKEANALNNIAGIYYEKGDLESAESLYQKSISIKESMSDFKGLAASYINLGSVNADLGKDSVAILSYEKSMVILEKAHDKKGISGTSNNIGSLYISQSEFRKALPYLIQSFSLGEEIGMIDYQSQAAENLSMAYAGLGEYREALRYHQAFTSLKDSLFNEDKAKEIGRLEATFTAQKEIDAKAGEVRERTLQRNATLVGLALVCLLGFVIIWGYHQRQRAAKQLAAQKEALNAQLMVELLHDQEVENLAALMEGQEQERKRIARDLHDRLGSKLATVRLHINGMESTVANSESEPQFIQSTKLLDEACQEVREIAHNMASGVLTHFGLVAAIREMANTLDSSGQIKVAVHEFEMEGYRMPSSMEIGIYRVIQELISNILKHARATEVNVHLTRFDHGLNLMVEDNGVGFDLLTQQSDQSGMGLQNMKSRLSKMGGTFEIDSAIGRGTTVLMDIPVNLQVAA